MKLVLICVFILSISISFSQKYETIAPGSWTDSLTWKDSKVPPFVFFDTVIINNPVSFDSILESNAYVRINSTGAICGHHKVILKQTTDIYGFFQVDTLDVFGAKVILSGSRQSIASYLIHIYGAGASFKVTASNFGTSVGPWFECDRSYFALENEEILAENQFILYPNPSSDFINIKGNFSGFDLQLIDNSGHLLLQQKVDSKIDVSSIASGIYFFQIVNKNEIIHVEKIVKN